MLAKVLFSFIDDRKAGAFEAAARRGQQGNSGQPHLDEQGPADEAVEREGHVVQQPLPHSQRPGRQLVGTAWVAHSERICQG